MNPSSCHLHLSSPNTLGVEWKEMYVKSQDHEWKYVVPKFSKVKAKESTCIIVSWKKRMSLGLSTTLA